MTYEEALRYYEETAVNGSRLGLERVQELLYALGDPQKQLKFVHIAGTNGKGSTAAMLASILEKAGEARVAQALGVNVIHFGMIVSIANVVGTMTPPVAVNIFSAASVTKLSMGKIVHGQWPFFIGYVGFFFLVVFIPALSTFLL